MPIGIDSKNSDVCPERAPSPSRTPLRLGVIAHPFLLSMGGTDFLQRLLTGLAAEPSHEITLLVPPTAERLGGLVPATIRRTLGHLAPVRRTLRKVQAKLEPGLAPFGPAIPDDVEQLRSACPTLELLPCPNSPASLRRAVDARRLDLLLPTMDPLPVDLPFITHWTDCQARRLPRFFDVESRRRLDERIGSLVASGRPMLINSRDAKADMVRFYGADPGRIFDLPFAPVAVTGANADRPASARSHDVAGPYALVSNQFWMHKSLETVLEAARIAKDRGVDVRFVFTGCMEEPRRPEYVRSLRQIVEQERLQDRVRFLGRLPKAAQIELMRHAAAVVQPTLFEGGPGGGAAFDAISLGVRLIASDIPVNHELPLEPGQVELFRAGDPESLLGRLLAMLEVPHRPPPVEELHRRSSLALMRLSRRLREAIDAALATGTPR